MVVVCSAVLCCSGCADRSVHRLVAKSRAAASAEEWRGWAEQVIERNKTNTSAPPYAEWPDFVKAVADDGGAWQVLTFKPSGQTNVTLVGVVRLGGFQSIGIIVGPATYVEATPPRNVPQSSEEIYPGIYVRETH
jgi:hypothetical protein